MFNKLIAEAAGAIAEAAGMDAQEAERTIEAGRFADLSSKVAFTLAKERKEDPAELAGLIASKLALPGSFEKAEAVGPYINFHFSEPAYRSLLSDILEKGESFGQGKEKEGKVIIEYPSVNPNKPWHIGHLRNALLGESVARMLEAAGHRIERMDYINDLGLQVAQSLWGFLNYDSKPEGKFDDWLGHQYVGIAKRFEEEKLVVEGVREMVKQMEDGDNEIAAAGRDLAETCVRAQYQTAFAFGVHHDVLVFESDILRQIYDEGMDSLKENDSVVLEREGKNAGCYVVKLSEEFEKEFGKMENPDKVLIRSDGTAVYTGKDLIFHLWKFGLLRGDFQYEPFMEMPTGKMAFKSSRKGKRMDFGHAARIINVIGVEQKYPQKVIAEIFARMGYHSQAAGMRHLSYEHVGLPDQKFSGRKGTWVGFSADDLLREAQSRILEKIKLDATDEEKAGIARAVGSGAIAFSFLKTSSDKRITFKWDEALNVEGDSGPYLQYAYVRTRGILGKAKEEPLVSVCPLNEHERRLILRLSQLPPLIEKGARELTPHSVAQYALDVAGDFTSFYSNSPVLNAPEEDVRRNRLAITLATSIVLKKALSLLCIGAPERM